MMSSYKLANHDYSQYSLQTVKVKKIAPEPVLYLKFPTDHKLGQKWSQKSLLLMSRDGILQVSFINHDGILPKCG